MSNLPEQNNDMERLKKARATILNTTSLDDLQREIADLHLILREMEGRSTGEILRLVERAGYEIQKFWLHDATRTEICKWVQTIISELNK